MRRRKRIIRRVIVVTAFILTAQVFALCCVSAVNATESRGFVNSKTVGKQAFDRSGDESYTEWLDGRIGSLSRCRSLWLSKLLTAAGYEVSGDVFARAVSLGVIDGCTEEEAVLPLTRRYVGSTMVRALGYPCRDAGYITDIREDESYMSAMAYYGYFLPDADGMIYPDKTVTDEEFADLLTELDRYSRYRGKKILSFGDSIMYGTGNDGEGLSDMIAEKYGMTCADYAVPGATFGVCSGRGHIPAQIREAYSAGQTADLILINGGTNDMNHTKLGYYISDNYNMSTASENDFTGAFERSLWMLRAYWQSVPVIYVRAHNMALGKDENERTYGDRAMELADKWDITAVDLYNNSELNTEDPEMCRRYTFLNPVTDYTYDAIHPTATGYATFYLPPVAEAVDSVFGKEVQ